MPSKSGQQRKKLFQLDVARIATGAKVGEAIVVTRNQRGCLGQVIQAIEEDGFRAFKVLGGAGESNNPEATYLIFFEAAEATASLQDLEGRISSLDSVLEAVVSGTEELLIDTTATSLLTLSFPSVIVGYRLLGEIENAISEMGQGGASALRWGGMQAAIRNVAWIRRTPLSIPKEEKWLLAKLIDFTQSAGWGIFSIKYERDGRPKQIIVNESFETVARKKSSKTSACYILEGYLAGLIDAIYNAPFKVVELQCKSQGDANCKFSIQAESQ